MAVSTLLIGLNELSVNQLTEVVSARGIDRVIVVASNSDFNNSAKISDFGKSNSQIRTLRSNGISVKLASTTALPLELSQANYNTISNSGFEFLTSSEFKSLTSDSTFVSSTKLSGANDTTVFPLFDSNSANVVGSYTTDKSGFGSDQQIKAASGSFTGLNDLNGTVTLNISATDFIDILDGKIDISNVKDKGNINSATGNALKPLTSNTDDGAQHLYTERPIQEFDGNNRIGNLNPNQTSHQLGQAIF